MKKDRNILSIINLSLFWMLLFVIAIRIGGTEVHAAGAWKGYAVYRDGVKIIDSNANDHAAIMDENTMRYA